MATTRYSGILTGVNEGFKVQAGRHEGHIEQKSIPKAELNSVFRRHALREGMLLESDSMTGWCVHVHSASNCKSGITM